MIEHSAELDGETRARTIRAVRSQATYSTSHIGCVSTTATGLRLRRGEREVDLLLDFGCKHLFDAESGDEIGFLSEAGRDVLTRIADLELQDPSSEPSFHARHRHRQHALRGLKKE